MAQNIFKNITVSLLILSFVLLPFLNFPAVAYAQYFGGPGLNSGTNLGAGTSQGIGGYMQAVGPMIPKLQGCGTMIKNGVVSGLNSIKSLFSSPTAPVSQDTLDFLNSNPS